MKDIAITVLISLCFNGFIYGQSHTFTIDSIPNTYKHTSILLTPDSLPICMAKSPSNNNYIYIDTCIIVKKDQLDDQINLIYIKEKGCDCIYKVISRNMNLNNLCLNNLYEVVIRPYFASDDKKTIIAQPQSTFGVIYNNKLDIIPFEDYPFIRDLYVLISFKRLD